MKRIVGYKRVSSAEQVEGTSLEVQEDQMGPRSGVKSLSFTEHRTKILSGNRNYVPMDIIMILTDKQN